MAFIYMFYANVKKVKGTMAVLAVLKQFTNQSSATLNYSLPLSLFCLISMLFVFKLTKRGKYSRFNLPPSPPGLPVIGNLHQLGTLPHRSLGSLSKKYGPVMLLQLGQTPTVVASSADVAIEIFRTHDNDLANVAQTTAAKILFYGCVDVAFARYGEMWREKRKFCILELLSQKMVRSFQSIREEEAEELVNKIRVACLNNGCSVNLSEMMMAAASNITCRCVIGQKYETEDGSCRLGELVRTVTAQLTAFSVGDFFPSLSWIDVLTGLIPKLKATSRELDAFFGQVIAERKTVKQDNAEGFSHGKDFMDMLLQLQQCGKLDFDLTKDVLKALLLDMLVAGTDTASNTLEWAFAELMKNPVTMKKAQEAVRRVVRQNRSKVDENDINQMSYLKCVVKETLRLHPPAPLLRPRETMSRMKLGSYDIPPKTSIFINAWAIHRDPEFWESPEEFLPERFENSQVDFKGQDFHYIPFGAGRRRCPGISFGLAAVEYLLANLLYWFDWKIPGNSTSVQDIDMSESYGATVTLKAPLLLEPIPYSFSSES